MDKLKPVPHATRCRCGNMLPHGATARYDKAERLYYDCHICRPRPAPRDPDPRDPDPTRRGKFQLHNCHACDHGRLPCRQGDATNCDNPRARND